MSDNTQAKALEVFGADRQVDKCLEELGELATVLMKYRHGEASASDVIDELADVMVTTGTLWLLFDRKAIEARIAVKLARLSRLVADQVAAKPEPKAVKPVLRWEKEGDDLVLHNGEEIGIVCWWPALAKWLGNPYGKTAMPCGAKADAMRHVEAACGLPEVPIWKP